MAHGHRRDFIQISLAHIADDALWALARTLEKRWKYMVKLTGWLLSINGQNGPPMLSWY